MTNILNKAQICISTEPDQIPNPGVKNLPARIWKWSRTGSGRIFPD